MTVPVVLTCIFIYILLYYIYIIILYITNIITLFPLIRAIMIIIIANISEQWLCSETAPRNSRLYIVEFTVKI